MSSEDPSGIVYLITDGNYYKIGKSTARSFRSRLDSIQTSNPNKIKIILTISVHDSFLSETSIKSLFRAHRLRGEWFDFSLPGLLDVVIATMRREEAASNYNDAVFHETANSTDINERWDEAFNRLVEICFEREYKHNWVCYRLQELKPTRRVWERCAALLGYKSAWASIQFDQQDEVLDPPSTMRVLAGLTRNKIIREKGYHKIGRKTVKRSKSQACANMLINQPGGTNCDSNE